MSDQAAAETQTFDAPAHDVWLLRLDFTNLPRYNPAVHDVERRTEGSGAGGVAGAGAAYRFTLDTPAGPHPVTLTVTGAEEDRRVNADMAGAMTAHESFVITPLDTGGCTAQLELWLDLPDGLDPATRDRMLEGGRREIRAELDAMKDVLDG